MELLGEAQISGNILARGTGGSEFAPCMIPLRLTSTSLARRRHLLNEMYNVKDHDSRTERCTTPSLTKWRVEDLT